ncbi:MAG: c-type cytochrome [Pirellulaceae bacterium]|jgi:putative membrane-bound dehydrogenase-like protein|nr:c-type cytochrome [Pirellulaceae bacterium]
MVGATSKSVLRCIVSAVLLGAATTWGAASICRAQDPPFREVLSQLPPRSPQDSLGYLQVRPGLRVELMAAEPLVCDPIAIDWGPDGRLWVVEMGDYPTGGDGSDNSRGRIRYLQDTDGDGRYDQSQIFLDDLSFPTGVMPWRRGLLITCAPEIFYAEDTDADGRADRREVLYRGFVEGNPQHRVNGLRWGLDGWIYGANGDSGGTITSLKTGAQIDIHARDFRIDPESGAIETQTGMAQYGRCRDDWGNWFGGRNLQPIWHCALEDHYLRRNPFLTPPDACVDLMDPPTCAPVFPISPALPRFNELWTANRFTSACGLEIYRDDLFGPALAHSYFICEPTHNLVHQGVLERRGTTFRGRRPADEAATEFLASRDPWFRPVQVRTGPDGALWVVDMYRLIIEHPDYIPQRWHAQLDFHAGRATGRLYRVLPEGVPPRPFRALQDRSTVDLVAALGHPNGPVRDLVQQLLIERQDRESLAPLQQLAETHADPKVRLAALCTLDALHGVTEACLMDALGDLHPEVRRHAVRIAEPWLSTSAGVAARVLAMVQDAAPQVRMQLAYSLGPWSDPQAGRALAAIAAQAPDDPLLIAAVMSSATDHPGEMLQGLLEQGSPRGSQVALVENLMRLALDAQRESSLVLGLQRVATPQQGEYATWQFQVMASLVDALDYSGDSLRAWYDRSGPVVRRAVEETGGLFAAARSDALDPTLDADRRRHAVRLVGRGLDARAEDLRLLADQLTAATPVQVQISVVDVLGLLRPADLPELLLASWGQLGPELRPRVLELLLRETNWTAALVDRIESGEIVAQELGAAVRSRLILHPAADVRRRAAQLLSPASPTTRLAVAEQYRSQLANPADATRGRAVFRKQCAQCHRLENEGTQVGPDLLALTDRSPEALLVSIVDPNRAVEPRYVQYSALTNQGHLLVGMIAAETGNSLTLIDAQGTSHLLLRADLDELLSTGRSLMPEGAEVLFDSPQDMLDLIAYLRVLEPDPYGDAQSRRVNPEVGAVTE